MTTPAPAANGTTWSDEQLAQWLRACTDEELLRFVRHARFHEAEAHACFVENHKGRLRDYRAHVEELLGQVKALTPPLSLRRGRHERIES